AAVRAEGPAHHPMVIAQDGRVSVAEVLKKAGRTLDVGKDEGDRSRGAVTHADASYGSGARRASVAPREALQRTVTATAFCLLTGAVEGSRDPDQRDPRDAERGPAPSQRRPVAASAKRPPSTRATVGKAWIVSASTASGVCSF